MARVADVIILATMAVMALGAFWWAAHIALTDPNACTGHALSDCAAAAEIAEGW